jgi:hypothetical protein
MVYWRGAQPPSADEASDETVRFILGLRSLGRRTAWPSKEGRGISWRLDMSGAAEFRGVVNVLWTDWAKISIVAWIVAPLPPAQPDIVRDRPLWVCRCAEFRGSGLSEALNTGYALWYTICVP